MQISRQTFQFRSRNDISISNWEISARNHTHTSFSNSIFRTYGWTHAGFGQCLDSKLWNMKAINNDYWNYPLWKTYGLFALVYQIQHFTPSYELIVALFASWTSLVPGREVTRWLSLSFSPRKKNGFHIDRNRCCSDTKTPK